MAAFNIRTEISQLIGTKYGQFSASCNALFNKYGLSYTDRKEKEPGSMTYCESQYFITYTPQQEKKHAEAYVYHEDEKEKYEIKDLTTKRTYSTGWVNSNKNNKEKFNSIMTHGYSIKDNGNGYIDEGDTIEGGSIKKPMLISEFLKQGK